MRRAIDENRSHYLQTTGVPRLLELLADKLRTRNGIPVGSPDEVLVTTGGIHALFIICQALLEPGDEVIIPDPEWPPCAGNIRLAHGVRGALSAPRVEGMALRPRPARVENHAEDPRDLRQLAGQPDRRRADPRRCRGDRRARRAPRPLADFGRGLRGRRLRRSRALQRRLASRHVRAHDLVLYLQQDLRDDRTAARLCRGERRDACATG